MSDKILTKRLIACLMILISVAIIIAAFLGVYVLKLNKFTDIIPDYTYGAEVEGVVEYRFTVDNSEAEDSVYVDDNGNIKGFVNDGSNTSSEDFANDTGYVIKKENIKANEESVLTKENFEKVKSIIEKRLDLIGATEYSIRMDANTGDFVVELSKNDNVSYLYETGISPKGEFRVIDYQTGVVLIDSSHLKNAKTYVVPGQDSYSVYLQLELDEEGAKILKGLSKDYIQYTDGSGESKTDYISIQVDGSALYTTYFGEEYNLSMINVPVGQDIKDSNTLDTYVKSTNAVANILNLGELPVKYTSNGGYLIKTNVEDDTILVLRVALVIALVFVTIIFAVKYKVKGLLGGILNAAFVGLLIIVLKYLKIVISMSSIISILVMVLINILFIKKYLEALEKNEEKPYLKTIKEYYSVIFSIVIVAFIFTIFSTNVSITGIGMVLFWGLLLQIIFNTISSKNVLEAK